jgi:hypothetical protein
MMVKMRAGAADTKLNKQQHRTQKTNISSCKERCGDVYIYTLRQYLFV